jgi:hypothetical protein
MNNNPLQTFVEEAPKIQKAYAGFIQSLISDEEREVNN